ncbi:very short patch repair endonuclease [Tardiphaga robiniae]|uniref:very short patch repair endonuclease n=1 Tax=Tardiphaga robiniae TaxID=943830 RepID=UPI0009D6F457|nr:very short patch repair endonuclease [Tardiphaga robiniae]
MADIVDVSTRSRMMSAIKGRDTKPELVLRRALHALGFRFRLHRRIAASRPDLIFPKYRAAVFVHGCFWHRHTGCKYCTTPSSNLPFWSDKFSQNVQRDARNVSDLRMAGWRVGVIWECQLTAQTGDKTLDAAARWLKSDESFFESSERG